MARLASPCRSDGTTIFVAFPFARTPSASRLFKVRTASSAPASLIARIPSAFACCTLRIASAWPSASRIRFSFSASARRIAACFSASASRIADCFLPSATRMVDFFSPSAIRIASRRSRSAFICFSIASWMAAGGIMFFSSTRFTLIPHGSVAISSAACIFVLMISRDVSVSSSSRSPMMFRSVVAVRFSIAISGLTTPYANSFGSVIWKNTTVSICIVTLSFVITGCGGKSTTCSFKFTRIATRSINGTLK